MKLVNCNFTIVMLLVIAVTISSTLPNKAIAGHEGGISHCSRSDFHGSGPGQYYGGCKHYAGGGRECWVEDNNNANILFPLITVKYKTSLFGAADITRKTVLGINECKWMWWYYPAPMRVCARIAPPGQYRNCSNVKENGSPRPQLCAYEDPMDGMDTDPYSSPFHHNTPNEEAQSVREGATTGAIYGAVIGLGNPFTAAYGAALGAMTAAIQSKHNHVVIRDLGCVDIPLGPTPPAWQNVEWFNTSKILPDFSEVSSGNSPSTYFYPKIRMKVCQRIDPKTNQGVMVPCSTPGAVGSETDGGEDGIILTPNTSNGDDDCATLSDGRKFCANVTSDQPDKVCIFEEKDGSSLLRSCLTRTNNMPKPRVDDSNTSRNNPNIKVSYGSQTKTLEVSNQDPTYFYQTPFKAVIPCIEYEDDTSAPFPSDPNNPTAPTQYIKKCVQEDNRICVDGFEDSRMAIKNRDTGKLIQGAPNVQDIDGVWVYYPPYCYQYSGSRCVNRACTPQELANNDPRCGQAGKCVDENCTQFVENNSDNLYQVNSNHVISTLTAAENNLCVDLPPDDTIYSYTSPGNHSFTTPTNCRKLKITLKGAGGAGSAVYGDDNKCKEHFSGGGGALGIWHAPTVPGTTMTISVGQGSQKYTGGSANGGFTRISGAGKSLLAGGGFGKWKNNSWETQLLSADNGGVLGGVSNWGGAIQQLGSRHGINGICYWLNDRGIDGSDDGITWNSGNCKRGNRNSNPGAGGCSLEVDNGQWSEGSHGKAMVQCLPGGPGSKPAQNNCDSTTLKLLKLHTTDRSEYTKYICETSGSTIHGQSMKLGSCSQSEFEGLGDGQWTISSLPRCDNGKWVFGPRSGI